MHSDQDILWRRPDLDRWLCHATPSEAFGAGTAEQPLSGEHQVDGEISVRTMTAGDKGHPWSPLLRARSAHRERISRANSTPYSGRGVIAKRLAGQISRAGPAEALMPRSAVERQKRGPWRRQLRTCSAPPGGSPACLNVVMSCAIRTGPGSAHRLTARDLVRAEHEGDFPAHDGRGRFSGRTENDEGSAHVTSPDHVTFGAQHREPVSPSRRRTRARRAVPFWLATLGQHWRRWSRGDLVVDRPPNGIIVPWVSVSSLSTMCS
jgi:hypothetical protein